MYGDWLEKSAQELQKTVDKIARQEVYCEYKV